MSVLLKDECECSSEFCGMLYRREKNEWRFSVVVSDVIESRTTLGHTDYRLVVTAVPKNGLELDTRQFSLLTRFKELNKLWSQLGKIHQQLYLHGTFPDFAPARFFKKTEPDTIIERVEGAKRFLNFIFDSDVLCKSRALQQFFEAAEEIAMTHDLTEPIAVTNVAEQSETAQDPSAVTSETPPSDSLDEVSLHSPPLTSAGNNTDDEEIEFEFNNVPINPFDAEREAGSPSFFGRMFPMFSSRAQHQTPRYSIQNRGAITAESIRPHSRTSSVSSVGVGNGTLAPNSGAVRTHDEEIDYLVQAGHFIGTAQRAETEKAYELAFHCYKNAVNILLQGVQFENDLSRRNAVRKKTVKYLMKAERLGRLYLSFDGTAFDMDSWLNISLQDPSLIAFQASNSALKTYKITDALPSFSAYKRVLLVEDPEGEKYALKLLEKSYTSALKSLEKPTAIKMNIAPVGVSNMVQMHKFFETDDFTILQLEYIEGGQLWTFLSKYFESRVEEFEAERESQSPLPIYRSDPNDAPTTSTALPSEAPETNVYSGRKVSFSVGYDPTEEDENAAFDTILRQHANARDSIDSVEGVTICPIGVDAAASLVAGFSPTSSSAFHRLRPFDESSSNDEDLPFRTVLSNSTLNASFEKFSVDELPRSKRVDADEEAPARINLERCDAVRRRTLSQKEGSEMNLEEALVYCRSKLTMGHKWSKSKTLPEAVIVHWMAQLVSALYVLHSQNVIVGDLRPENLLVDMEGNLKLTYQSRWTNVEQVINRNSKEARYCAPEIGKVNGIHSDSVDRFSVGLICYELLCGVPFDVINPHGPSNYTVCELQIPPNADISFAAHDLLTRLLITNPQERLSDDDLRAHPFFTSCDWSTYDTKASPRIKQAESTVSNYTNTPGSNNLVIGNHSPKNKNSHSESISSEPEPDFAKTISEPLNPVSLVKLTQP